MRRASLVSKCDQCGKEFRRHNPVKPGSRSFCSNRCVGIQKIKDRSVLLFKRTKVSASGCWELTRSLKGGYGRVALGGKNYYAHRLAWEFTHGEIPPDKLVLHRCDNPACINPDHLYLGDRFDNARDRWERRPGNFIRGDRCHRAVLNEDSVRRLREMRASGASLKRIAAEFGICTSSAHAVATGKAWRHIP